MSEVVTERSTLTPGITIVLGSVASDAKPTLTSPEPRVTTSTATQTEVTSSSATQTDPPTSTTVVSATTLKSEGGTTSNDDSEGHHFLEGHIIGDPIILDVRIILDVANITDEPIAIDKNITIALASPIDTVLGAVKMEDDDDLEAIIDGEDVMRSVPEHLRDLVNRCELDGHLKTACAALIIRSIRIASWIPMAS